LLIDLARLRTQSPRDAHEAVASKKNLREDVGGGDDGNEEARVDASLRVIPGMEELVSEGADLFERLPSGEVEGVASLVAGAERSGSPVALALQACLVSRSFDSFVGARAGGHASARCLLFSLKHG
jgi:hypothetical protein